ncbi:MAG TPA: acyl carrier protein [Anaerolineae bacterium]|nr:acyl carrier protein [Anaerolineae bacterium]
MNDKSNPKLSFDEFRKVLSEELMLDEEKLKPEATLIQDLQVDSLALASMMIRMEEMGYSFPIESAWEMETVGDVYNTYLQQA